LPWRARDAIAACPCRHRICRKRKADYFCARQRRDSVQRIFPCRFHLRPPKRLHGLVQICD
jgi:hypothetical protein